MIKKELRFTDCPIRKSHILNSFMYKRQEEGAMELSQLGSYVLRMHQKFQNIFHTRSKNVINGSENNYDCRLVYFCIYKRKI